MIVRGVDTSPDWAHYADLETDERPRVISSGSTKITDDGSLIGYVADYRPDIVVVERLHGFGKMTPKAEFDAQWVAGMVFQAALEDSDHWGSHKPSFVLRRDVKLHLLGSTSGNDDRVIAALYDRFGGDRCYGVKGHEWQALAVAVTWWERENRRCIG